MRQAGDLIDVGIWMDGARCELALRWANIVQRQRSI